MHIWNILILSAVIYLKTTYSNELTPLVLQGFLPMTGSGWPGGGACLPPVEMALRHINSRAGLLDGYNLTYTWVDTKAPVPPYYRYPEPHQYVVVWFQACDSTLK